MLDLPSVAFEESVGMGTLPTAYGSRFGRALAYTEATHRMQVRKGSNVPYIGHLLGVASIVIDNGGTEDEAIGALLHDAAEDQGGQLRLDDIAREFGQRVSDIVAGCSDSTTADPTQKAPWLDRKLTYLKHLADDNDESVMLVSVADKTHNLRSMLADYMAVGEALWSRFSAKKVGTIRYYRSLLDVYEHRREPKVRHIAKSLRETLQSLELLSGAKEMSELADGRGLSR